MKKLFSYLIAALLLSFGATAFAQCIPMNAVGPPRNWDGVRGCWVPMGTPSVDSGSTVQVIRPVQQIVVPTVVQAQQVVSNPPCSAIATWGGGLVGAAIGNAIGQGVTTQGHRLGGLGAVVGAVAGSDIGCELARSRNQPQQQQVVVQGNGQQQVVTRVAARRVIPRPPVGNYPCRFALNGVLVDTALTTNKATCDAWTDELGADAGGVLQQ